MTRASASANAREEGDFSRPGEGRGGRFEQARRRERGGRFEPAMRRGRFEPARRKDK